MDEMFTPDDVISQYTDADAQRDGCIVNVGESDRVTRQLWDWLHDRLPTDTPPERWPVALFEWCSAPKNTGDRETDQTNNDIRCRAATRGLLDVHRTQAVRVYEDNIGGGIYTIWPQHADGRITGLRTEGGGDDDHRVWFVPNEMGGLTLMFPSDY